MRKNGITTYTVPPRQTETQPIQVTTRRENGMVITEANYGHKGRPGQVGGSSPKGGGESEVLALARTLAARMRRLNPHGPNRLGPSEPPSDLTSQIWARQRAEAPAIAAAQAEYKRRKYKGLLSTGLSATTLKSYLTKSSRVMSSPGISPYKRTNRITGFNRALEKYKSVTTGPVYLRDFK